MPPWAIAFLILTAAISYLQSRCYYLVGGDELLELWGDKASSIAQLVHVQRVLPTEIDPFFYHALNYAGIRLFGVNPPVLRLPSLLGFLLMQVCLFYFVRRIASTWAAVFALVFPAFTGAFWFSGMMRPYGLLLGLFGLAMLSWQTAARRKPQRALALVVLALTIALAINTHYYGVLLLVPLGVGELVRCCQSRRLDRPMLVSLAAGMAGVVFLLPFLKGAAAFRTHYQTGLVPYQLIPQSYNSILFGQAAFSTSKNHLLAFALGLLFVLALWSCLRQLSSKTLRLPLAELVFLVTLAALPFVACLLGRFVTGAMEPRYALGSVIGIAALLAIALAPLFRYRPAGSLVLLLLFAALAHIGFAGIRAVQLSRQKALTSLILSPQIKAAVMASPSGLLYFHDIDLFGFAACYLPDDSVRSRLALVYSSNQELRWNRTDVSSRLVLHLKSLTSYTIVPYESLAAQPGDRIFVVTQGGWNWVDKAFAAEHVLEKPIGSLAGAEVVSVHLPPAAAGPSITERNQSPQKHRLPRVTR